MFWFLTIFLKSKAATNENRFQIFSEVILWRENRGNYITSKCILCRADQYWLSSLYQYLLNLSVLWHSRKEGAFVFFDLTLPLKVLYINNRKIKKLEKPIQI